MWLSMKAKKSELSIVYTIVTKWNRGKCSMVLVA